MTSQVLSRQHALFLTGGGRRKDRLRKTLIVSLVLHVCVLALIAGFRFKKVERPLSAVEVSLVTAPTPEVKPEAPVEKAKPVAKPVQPAPIAVPPKPVQTPPPSVQTKPAPMQAKPAPAPSPPPAPSRPSAAPPSMALQAAPSQPAPSLVQPVPPAPTLTVPQPIPQTVKPSPAAPVRSRRDVMEDLLKDIELPPNAPKFGDLSPMKPAESRKPLPAKLEHAQEKPQNDLEFLKKLKVPEMAAAPIEAPKESSRSVPVPPKVPSLSEDKELNRELKEFKPLQAPPTVKLPEPVRETKPMFREPPVRSAPVQQQSPPVSASVPKISKTPVTKMNVPGSSGSNPYLALVQRAINEKWTAPPVDISGAALTVVIRFRLSRNGVISGVAITQQSGNDYYDLAGRRAVLSVDRLPPFPPDIAEKFYDIFYTFAVGEGSG
ncbi:MAG: TonB C-terminal domain-containing protein [Nitrospiraceae bacterium]